MDRAPAARGGGRARSAGSGGRSRAADALDEAAKEVFEALRGWRTAVAQEKQNPPWTV